MKNGQVRLACEPRVVTLNIAQLLPMKRISTGTKGTAKYRRIAASIREVGIIEPLVVYPQQSRSKAYMILDGNIRYEILIEIGTESVECLIALDDEAFTYNHKVNRLSPIQEHFMILKAIKSGVSEDRIAKTLDVDVAAIRKNRDLLDRICAEAVSLLKGKRVTGGCLREVRRVAPMRQIEIAELMGATNNFSVEYAKCLVAATQQEQLAEPNNPKEVDGLAPQEMARIERELESISTDFKQIEETHGQNVLNLVIVVGYLKKLMDNARVVRFLSQSCPDILGEFQKIVESRNLAEGEDA